MRVFFIVLMVFLSGCSNNAGEAPLLACKAELAIVSDLKEFHSGVKLLIPRDWDSEIIENGDGSVSEVCLDTLLLFNEELVRSITVTKFPFKRKSYSENMEKEINLIRQKRGTTLIDYGYQSVNNSILDWIYFKDTSMHSIIYYLRDEKYIIFDFSVSQHVFCEERLCEIIGNIETLERFN